MSDPNLKRRFGSLEEIERAFFPRLFAERQRRHRLESELTESDEALRECEAAHGALSATPPESEEGR